LSLSKILIILSLILVISSVNPVHSQEKTIIVTTTDVIGSIVRGFIGDNAEVVVLCHPGLCPADFDMKPSDIYAVSNAKILFKQDIPGEFWLKALVEAAGNDELIQVAIPGVYNTPDGAKKYVSMVADNLASILDLDLAEREAEMIREIDDASEWMSTQAESVEVSNVNVICMSWLRLFIESIGFQVVAIYNPPETLSASDITSLISTAKNENVALVVDNLQIDVEFGKGIADQVGAEHAILTNFPGAVPKTGTLAEMFRYNAEQLFESTEIWRYSNELEDEKKSLLNQLTIYQILTALLAVIAAVEGVLIYSIRK
jgi:ABC-type Zn uptake system ZnuABC Zn-binding protein ZnuA